MGGAAACSLRLPYYIYYLFLADKSDELVCVGRSQWPHTRRVRKEREQGTRLRMLTSFPIKTLQEAQQYEVAEIRALRPRLNKLIQSSPGSTGKHINLGCALSVETRLKISAARRNKPGHPQTDVTRAKIRAAFKGIPLASEHRAKIGHAQKGVLNHMYGKTRSLEARVKTSSSLV